MVRSAERICEVCGGEGHSKGFHKKVGTCASDTFMISVDFDYIAVETKTDEFASTPNGVPDDRPILDGKGKEV